MHRDGCLHLLLLLPDGTRSLIPAAWTDLEGAPAPTEAGMLASLEDLLGARRVLDGILRGDVLPERDDRPTAMACLPFSPLGAVRFLQPGRYAALLLAA
jgi:hypothetical protein